MSAVVQSIPDMNATPKDDAMKCSLCGGEMERGRAILGQTLAGVFVAGLALPNLFFESPCGGKKSVLDWRADDVAAHRCPKCGVVMFQGKRD